MTERGANACVSLDTMSDNDRHQTITKPPAAVLVCLSMIMCITAIAQLVKAVMCQYECPGQPSMTIYLLVMGVISLLLVVLSVLPCIFSIYNHTTAWSCLMLLFFFTWFLAGNMWIYSLYEPNYNDTQSHMDAYCNKKLHLFAFWTTNLNYMLLGFLSLCSCCSCLLCSK
ncbi:transmembrane protein 272-like [Melanotaenia boesemani]|uniref:transmembrane protein 272-like n=1 Tax=Melanotaenia boesemani TaxID=1250792 RepID=UPI001C04B465|nr:transmembrane protein 272-like [Melanotaenia boesemani]